MKRVLLGLMLSTLSLSSWAVDGYKDVKFGSSVKDLMNSKLCNFQKIPPASTIKELSLYSCLDFNFSGKKTMAIATFLNGKFKRFLIGVDSNINPLIDALNKKYGLPSSMTSEDIMVRALTTGEPVFVRYDNDTVIIKVEKSNGQEVTMLMYTDSKFDDEINALSQNKIANDI
ncbi:hypothetical protein [Xenorhabdus ehlersii]|uniref:Uncharacterized protein n=1 Tax=Xenorhabdus ehlersii TaxID=290111 RepID=A0A2D0IL99_9GAMM|nr:hypothetical protein [Xenorhabdus ehlersii]PHM22552.1 hypothetical protein Xehl_03563 [Xenorhabdus ehlersii]RKE91428.1 hypothetical protein BDE27_1650 [Xenorhabdus ehlersii]